MNQTVAALAVFLVAPGCMEPQSGSVTIGVDLPPTGIVAVLTQTTVLKSPGAFSNYSGATNLLFSVRTTPATGSGTLTVSFSSDWKPAGGPSITATPAQLSYTCGAIGGFPPLMGATPCSGSLNVNQFNTPMKIVTFGPGSLVFLGTETQTWTLTNSPAYAVGNYTTTATYTLSVS